MPPLVPPVVEQWGLLPSTAGATGRPCAAYAVCTATVHNPRRHMTSVMWLESVCVVCCFAIRLQAVHHCHLTLRLGHAFHTICGAAKLWFTVWCHVLPSHVSLRFLEEEAEELRRLNEEHAAEAKLKREQQLEREKMVSIQSPCVSSPFGRQCSPALLSRLVDSMRCYKI